MWSDVFWLLLYSVVSLRPTFVIGSEIDEEDGAGTISISTVKDLFNLKIGACTYQQVLLSSMKCESEFFVNIRERPELECRQHFITMQKCKSRFFRECLPAPFLPDNYQTQFSIDEGAMSTYCQHGSLVVGDKKNETHGACLPQYDEVARSCMKDFVSTFTRDKTDQVLCGKYLQARACMYEAEDMECEYEGKEGLDVNRDATRIVYKCWNPFCFLYPEDNPRNKLRGIDPNCSENAAFKFFSQTTSRSKYAMNTTTAKVTTVTSTLKKQLTDGQAASLAGLTTPSNEAAAATSTSTIALLTSCFLFLWHQFSIEWIITIWFQ